MTTNAGSSGKASATLTVTASALALSKSFTDDPVPPGGTVTLEFTIQNLDRSFSATSIGFTDMLPAGLSITGSPTPNPPCGAASVITGTTTLSFIGGTLPPEGMCAFSVQLSVPVGAMAGSFINTTSEITADVDGTMVTGSAASEIVVISPAPALTKTFTDDPVGSGDVVPLSFSVTNTSPSSMATEVAFMDELTNILGFPVTVGLPPTPDPPCGGSSSLALALPFTRNKTWTF